MRHPGRPGAAANHQQNQGDRSGNLQRARTAGAEAKAVHVVRGDLLQGAAHFAAADALQRHPEPEHREHGVLEQPAGARGPVGAVRVENGVSSEQAGFSF